MRKLADEEYKIHVVRSQVGFGQYIASAFRHFFYRSLKDQAAVHADERITDDLPPSI